MIVLCREKTVDVQLGEGTVRITYRIPSAVELEEVFVNKLKDSELFKKFVIRIDSDDISDIEGKSAKDFLDLPGAFKAMNAVCRDLIAMSTIGETEKN